MAKILFIVLIAISAIIGGLAVYLLTGENLEKTILMIPPLMPVLYFVYCEMIESDETNHVT